MIKSKKKAKKPKNAYPVIRMILAILACIVLLIGIGARVWHYFTVHQK